MTVFAGDTVFAVDVSLVLAKPLVRLVQTVAQSIPDNVAAAITFTTEDIDTHNFHSTVTNTSRITPTVAGYYRFYGSYQSATPTSLIAVCAFFAKNGTSMPPSGRGNDGAMVQSQDVTAIIACNGSTDYVELMALQDSSGAVNTNVGTPFISVFEAEFLRQF